MRKLIPLAIIILSLFLFTDIFSVSSDEQEVRRTFRELLDDFKVHQDTPVFDRIFKAKKISKYFSEDFKGILERDSGEEAVKELTPKKIEETLLGYYRVTQNAHPEIISEEYESTGSSVILNGLVRIIAEVTNEEPKYLEELKFRLVFEEISDDWLITSGKVRRIKR